jgi:hypothetical protein
MIQAGTMPGEAGRSAQLRLLLACGGRELQPAAFGQDLDDDPDLWGAVEDMVVVASVLSSDPDVREWLARVLRTRRSAEWVRQERSVLAVFRTAGRLLGHGCQGLRVIDPKGFASDAALFRAEGERYWPALLESPVLGLRLRDLARAHLEFWRQADAVDVFVRATPLWLQDVEEFAPEIAESLAVVGMETMRRSDGSKLVPLVLQWADALANADTEHCSFALRLAGELAFRMGDLDGAERRFRRLASEDADDGAGLAGLAWFLVQTQRYTGEALSLARQALALSPEDPAVQHTAGTAEWRIAKDRRVAERLLSSALRALPDDAEVVATWAAFTASDR